jgi:hypothetical protein
MMDLSPAGVERILSQFSEEFPDVIADAKRVADGKAAETEIYRRTVSILHSMKENEPELKDSPVLLLASARWARQQLAVEWAALDTALREAYLLLDARAPGWRSFFSEIGLLSYSLKASGPTRTPEAIADYLELLYLCALGKFSISKQKETIH